MFVNATLGYSIELTPPWRRSACFSGAFTREGTELVHDYFMVVPAYDEQAGDVGGLQHGHVVVSAQSNPDRLTPRQWLDARRTHSEATDPVDDTFAGEPALRLSAGEVDHYLLAHERWMVEMAGRPGRRDDTTQQQRSALLASIRFLDPQELAAARAAPTPSPGPRTAEEVADLLAVGFARKDPAVLRRAIEPACIQNGVYEGGISTVNTDKYLDQLRDRFARGLTVEVQRSSLTSGPQFSSERGMVLGSVWREPGQPEVTIDLMIQPDPPDSQRWYWTGTLANAPDRR